MFLWRPSIRPCLFRNVSILCSACSCCFHLNCPTSPLFRVGSDQYVCLSLSISRVCLGSASFHIWVELHAEPLSLLEPPILIYRCTILHLVIQRPTHSPSKFCTILLGIYSSGTFTLKSVAEQRFLMLLGPLWFSPCLHFFSYGRGLWPGA